jgi:hypothetical protein
VTEPWLDRKKLADHYSCSVRSVETALSAGCPHAVIFGRVKFQVSAVEPFLKERGYLRLVEGTCTVADANGAAPLTRPAPDTEG